MTMIGSLYEDTAPAAPETAALMGAHEAEFVIIGAGFTGLSAAIHAAKRSVKTVVIEANGIGHGGSGRNHGHCVPVYGFINPNKAIETLGRERGERLTRILADSGKRVFSLIREYDMDCEAAPTGALQLAHSPKTVPALQRQHDFYASLGTEPKMLNRDEAVAITGSEEFHGGWIHTGGGHLNPLAYARGLARAAMREGAEVFTDSPVVKLERKGGAWLVTCPHGTVLARRVGLATGAYTDNFLPPLGKSFFTMRSYAIASTPLDIDLRRTILPDNHNFGDTRHDVRYVRFDKQNRLIMGGLVEPIIGTNFKATTDFISRRVREMYPQIKTIDWRWHWSGQLDITMDRTPRLYNPAEGLYALVGYSGRGVPTATALGEVLGEAGTGVAPEDLPMPIAEMRSLNAASLLSVFVPMLRGPINRMRTRIESKVA
ncbi:FAD dependent oxidoreductase [Rhizobium sp. CF080]|uniref:NAD(P)/FAD-dependent oxidoreductase n=1 Tax=Rhizobium sp. (strain CF080) TaxID=1144310 RepID=UPI0002717792|nr:FAD-binding oxidoreductase [Rhizobium sp. CF080]EUB99470.1 FAD dependent oxidoreductase [Rhizobium sp. CF080]